MFSHNLKSIYRKDSKKILAFVKCCSNDCVDTQTSNQKPIESQKRIKLKRNEFIDYLGISDANTKDDVCGRYRSELSTDELNSMYSSLIENRDASINEENIMVTSFGKVRLDIDNAPQFHGQYDAINCVVNKFDINEFQNDLIQAKANKTSDNCDNERVTVEKAGNIIEDLSSDNQSDNNCNTNFGYIDEHFLKPNASFKPLYESKIKFKHSKELMGCVTNESTQYLNNENINVNYNNKSFINKFNIFESPLKNELFPETYEIDYNYMIRNVDSDDEMGEEEEKLLNDSQNTKQVKLEDIELEEKKEDLIESPTPKTGAELVRDLQMGNVSPQLTNTYTDSHRKYTLDMQISNSKLDSKGFRLLKTQVHDWTKFTNEDIVEILHNNILFNDSDILVINKPYGISMHGGEVTKHNPVLTMFLPQLAEKIECEKLYTVHRLDMFTTGILILAKSQQKAHFLNRLFIEHKIYKQYWCITRGVPDNREGVIDIPIELGSVDGIQRMVLRPEVIEDYRQIKPSKTAKRAVTQYKVLSENKNAALIEVTPQTGIKHQIRVHLGFGVRCPILGDHKYSHLNKLAPQQLPSDMLLALNVRQAKVRHIPMHLHSRKVVIPEAGMEGKNIFVHSPLPPHFIKNMASLKLRH